MPDLNSLPPSANPSARTSPTSLHRASLSPQIPSPLSRSPTSTAPPPASAPAPPPTGSPRLPRSPIERRRSSLIRDFSLNDGSGGSPSPNGETPLHHAHHHRAPSLGELHQELENEQEAQVNRLLAMIRQQQAQIQQSQSQLQAQAQAQQQPDTSQLSSSLTSSSTSAAAAGAAVASSTPGSSRPSSTVHSRPQSQTHVQQSQGTSTSMPPPSSATSLSRQSSSARPARSRTNSQHSYTQSPLLRPHEGLDWSMGRERDEVAFYQTETAMVQRENQMLKGRIRELERMLQGLSVNTGGGVACAGGADDTSQPHG